MVRLQRWSSRSVLLACFLPYPALAAFPWATAINRTAWNVTSSSSQVGNEPASVIDGSADTFWHSQYAPTVAALPHYIQFDMGASYIVNGISYVPRQDGKKDGNIGQHTITLSDDGVTWTSPVSYGTFQNNAETKDIFFANATARYLRLLARTEAQATGSQYASMAEFQIYSPDPALDAATFVPPPASLGQWGPTVVLPVTGGAAALQTDDTVVYWSAFEPNDYLGGSGLTQTAVWSYTGEAVSQITVSNTNHDMFCPGISLNADGDIVVTGGNDDKRTSILGSANASWMAAPQSTEPSSSVNVGRGYQSTATLANGHTFNIGGSWKGGRGGKYGEIFNGTAWRRLPGAAVEPLLTQDKEGVYRSDNHAWLFPWTGNSIFQAGPSSAMNWYGIGVNGSWKAAGARAADPDSMCGTAAMFDGVAGLILTAGGSPDYQDSNATGNAHLIKLGAVDADPDVTVLPSMAYPRAFANSVILPNGQVLVVGGQHYALPFSDDTAAFPAELFDPATNTWSTVASIAVPRTYHSVALLLPDATVVSAGGGICGRNSEKCAAGKGWNHYDSQIYRPSYLFDADGSAAARPTITSASPLALEPGATLTVTTDTAATFAMVRYGSSTHTVNTDQRRVPLEASAEPGGGWTYTMVLPRDPGVLLPGYWMLFAINEAGVPSVSTQVKVLLASMGI